MVPEGGHKDFVTKEPPNHGPSVGGGIWGGEVGGLLNSGGVNYL